MAEQRLLFGDGFRVVMHEADGTVFTMFVADTDLLDVLDRIRFLQGVGLHIERIELEKVE